MARPPDETFTLRQLRHDLQDTAVMQRMLATTADAEPEACLVHIYPTGPDLGRRYQIGPDPVVIGRDPDCTACAADRSVSRQHATVGMDANGLFVVADLGSTNGTFVNHARVQTAVLRDGDYLQAGNCIFRFLAGGNLEAEYHEEIHRLTVLDPLTGIHNRRSLAEFLDRELERARRHARPLAVVLFDLDHFKKVNDRLGHLGGDFALKAVAARIKAMARKEELLARYGGEEFALVLPETDLVGAVLCGERIRRAVADTPLEVDRRPLPVTVSVGAAARAGADPVSADDLLRRADDRLYEAKRAGRNRVAPPAPAGPLPPAPPRAEPPTQTSTPIAQPPAKP